MIDDELKIRIIQTERLGREAKTENINDEEQLGKLSGRKICLGSNDHHKTTDLSHGILKKLKTVNSLIN
jgi:hypothetical protein